MQRATREWRGMNQNIPLVMTIIWEICSIALLVLLVFIFIKVRPWWYGLIMIVAGYVLPILLPPIKSLETVVAMIGLVCAPLFTVLSYLKLFAII